MTSPILTSQTDIDRAHFALVEMAHAMTECGTFPEMALNLVRLCEVWDSHCDAENRLMSKSDYPLEKEHIADHTRLSALLCELASEFGAGAEGLQTAGTVERIRQEFLTHFVKHDRSYAMRALSA